MKFSLGAAIAMALSVAVIGEPAIAQSGRIFKADELSPAALIDALSVRPAAPASDRASTAPASPVADEPDEPITTRSIRVRPNAAPPKPRPQPVATAAAPRPSASLLITFETNSATLTAQAQQTLDVVAKALASDQLGQYRFAVEGHADPRGGADFNLRLSEQRAESVRQYLVQRHGIAESKLSAVGKGDRELANPQNPVAPENRRVTIVNLSN